MEPNQAQNNQSTPPQNQPVQPVVQSQPLPQQPVGPYQPSANNPGSGFAIAALVLGIIAFMFSWLSWLNFLTCILAIVFGIIALNKHQSKGMGLTGLILGAVGLIASIVWLIIGIVLVSNS